MIDPSNKAKSQPRKDRHGRIRLLHLPLGHGKPIILIGLALTPDVRVGIIICVSGVYTYFCVAPFSYTLVFVLVLAWMLNYYGFADVLILVMADITAYSLHSTAHTAYGLYQDISMSCGVFLLLLTYYTDV
jgi:hypothetical protein